MRMITIMTAVLATAGLVLSGAGCARGAGGPDLAAVAPCDLLTPAQLATAGLGAGRAADTGPARSCTWTRRDAGFAVPVATLLVFPGEDLDGIRSAPTPFSGGYTDAEVGGLAALRTSGPGCTTVVDVGSGLLSMVEPTGCADRGTMIELAVANLLA
ncbi:DUF3558 family protein [Pseudonocardia broussonetiae]|uniref:DUF3558 family protein n=1 Tax=Pseudonocardia broussonetiae TaxID=2736640 RepID=A0A6M6JR87_9PSEU|nr:DUF3558 family protein [Pseudonocardia broussonetiae]QJY49820.1 DUF3558 family protein [Pseudonocardia broussonetiae]